MPRMTEKLSAALRLLHITDEPIHPAIVYYGRLAELGWKWTGEQWEQKTAPFVLSYPAGIRVMADDQTDCSAVRDFVAKALRDAGFTVDTTYVKLNNDGRGWRTYLTVE